VKKEKENEGFVLPSGRDSLFIFSAAFDAPKA
jgi:hypothetical protein